MYSKKVVIRYTADNVDQPIICQLVKKHDLDFNILKAQILPRREGVIVVELSGLKENFDKNIVKKSFLNLNLYILIVVFTLFIDKLFLQSI